MSEETQIQVTDVEAIREQLEGLWNALYEKPELTQALANVWAGVQALEQERGTAIAEATGLQIIIDELEQQRNDALYEAAIYKERGDIIAKRKIAAQLAVELKGVKIQDVQDTLDFLTGDSDACIAEDTFIDFVDALQLLVEDVRDNLDLEDYS